MTVFMYLAMSALIQTYFPIVSAGYSVGVHVTWTGLYEVIIRQHSFFCVQVKAVTYLTFLPRNQSDNSNTLLHFSTSHLFLLSLVSPSHSASPLVCLYPSSPTHAVYVFCQEPESEDDITWYSYYPKHKRKKIRCQCSSVVLTFEYQVKLGVPTTAMALPLGVFA